MSFREILAVLILASIGLVQTGHTRELSVADLKPSEYAKVGPLEQYLAYLIVSIEKDLADGDEYGEEQSDRVVMRAHTLAAVTLVLHCHDVDNRIKPHAQKILELASELASVAENQAPAEKVFESIKQVLESAKEKSNKKAEWETVADVAELMKAVPIVNNQMRRGVNSRRFERSVEKTAMYAAALAAVAQAASIDDSYCEDEAAFAKWKKLCNEMRDGAAEVSAALNAKDQDKAQAAMAKIVKSCDACHDDFR